MINEETIDVAVCVCVCGGGGGGSFFFFLGNKTKGGEAETGSYNIKKI